MPDPLLRIPVRLDLDGLSRDKADLLRTLSRLEGQSVNVRVDLDDSSISSIQSRLDGLDTTITPNLDIDDGNLGTLQSRLDDLDVRLTPEIDVGDGNLSSIESRLDDLDSKITTQVDINLDDGGVSDLLTDIRNIGAIDLVMNVAGSASGLITGGVETLLDFSGIGGLIDTDVALATIEAGLGETIPNGAEMIDNIFLNNWGESKQQIAEMMMLAGQLDVPFSEMEDAVSSALLTAAVTGEDANQVLRTMVNLNRNDLVDSYGEASDAIVGGFQNGLNVGEDYLDTLNEYGSTFDQLGLDVGDVMAILNSGLGAGIDNTDRVADLMREFNIRVREGGEEIQQAFTDLNLEDEFAQFQAGDLSGGDLFVDVFEQLEALEGEFENSTAVTLLGTQVEDFGVDTFIEAITTANEALIEFEGSADKAGSAISDTLPAAWERLERVVSTELGQALDEQFDITGFIDESTVAIQGFFDNLQSGQGIGTSLRLSLDDTRLGDLILSLREGLSDFVFNLLSGLRSVVAAIPGVSTGGIDDLIGNLGSAELELDLQLAESAEDVADAVDDALNRGIDASEVLQNLDTQFQVAIEVGDVEQLVALNDQIQRIGDVQEGGILNQFMSTEEIEGFAEGFASEWIPDDFEPSLEAWNEMFEAWEVPPELQEEFRSAVADIIENPELSTLSLEELIDYDSFEQQTQEAIGNLETQLSDSLVNDDFTGALDIASTLTDLTGEDFTGQVAFLASDWVAGLSTELDNAINDMDLDLANDLMGELGDFASDDLVEGLQQLEDYLVSTGEVTAPLEETADSVVASVDETTDAVTTSLDETEAQVDTTVSAIESRASDLDTAYTGMGTGVQDMATVTDESLLAAYASVDAFVTNSEARLVRLADIVGGVNSGWETLMMTASTMPAGAMMVGGAGGSSTTNNTTNNFNVNNQNGAAAQASNSLFEQVGGGMPQ